MTVSDTVGHLHLPASHNGTHVVVVASAEHPPDSFLPALLNWLAPGSRFFLLVLGALADVSSSLLLAGFIDSVEVSSTVFQATKPDWALGATQKLARPAPKPVVWSLGSGDLVDDDLDLYDDDAFLDEADKAVEKPVYDCGTTDGGVRSACANCSCGLKEELDKQAASESSVEAKPKSACGSCYLGDAFRCATCPYLGQPAFKPGEQVKLQL